jgi:glycosyltransferase involved in cell wall biosynthesis
MKLVTAHIVLALDVGGLERVVLNLVGHGVKHGQAEHVVCVERLGTLVPQIEEAGAQIHCVDKGPGLRLRMIGELRRLFREIRPDVVHTHQTGALFYAGPAAKRERVPVIVHTEHGNHYNHAPFRTRMLAKFAAMYSQRFFCVSTEIADTIVRRGIAPRRKVSVIANGIETEKFAIRIDTTELKRSLGIPPGAQIVGTVGNLREVKRQDVLIRGFAAVSEINGQQPHLVIVGEGDLREQLTTLAAELGVADRVHLVGRQTNPEHFLQLMDVFSLTSRSEGMPMAILEAWATGLPVVASRVGGLPELIEEQRTGVMFESGNVSQLTGHLRNLLQDREKSRQMGLAGQELVRARYDVSAMADTYHRQYMELLGDGVRAEPVAGVR